MDAITRRTSHRPGGLRAGIVIGLALALVGVVVGTATGAVTQFQMVVIKNTATEPVPVAGTVNVGNTPANQNVTVSNFPTTQAVTVGNFPATQTVGGTVRLDDVRVFQAAASVNQGEVHVFTFYSPMHVTGVTLNNMDSDTMELQLVTSGGDITLHDSDSSFSRDFTAPVPATAVRIFCGNLVLDCFADVTVFGY